MKIKNPLIILGGIILLIGFYLIGVYNSLVGVAQEVDGQWAQVETQYQRRFDLIPNLLESTKGIFEQEKEVFGLIADARSRYSGAANQTEKVKAANSLESAIGRLLVIVESYPELKSNETVLGLMDELAGTENRVSVERKRYNDKVKIYNVKTKTFPTVLVAGMLGFADKAYFEAAETAQEAPVIDFN
ncbi:MAG: LemA family protein [Patescibacteria group bacterium]